MIGFEHLGDVGRHLLGHHAVGIADLVENGRRCFLKLGQKAFAVKLQNSFYPSKDNLALIGRNDRVLVSFRRGS